VTKKIVLLYWSVLVRLSKIQTLYQVEVYIQTLVGDTEALFVSTPAAREDIVDKGHTEVGNIGEGGMESLSEGESQEPSDAPEDSFRNQGSSICILERILKRLVLYKSLFR